MPAISPPTKWPTTFITAAAPSTTNRSSNSRYMKVTRVCRLRFTGVTCNGISRLLLNAGRSALNPELAQPQQAGKTERAHRRDQVSDPGFSNRHSLQQSPVVGNRQHDLKHSIKRQKHIADPVHQSEDRDPVAVRVVPCRLVGK